MSACKHSGKLSSTFWTFNLLYANSDAKKCVILEFRRNIFEKGNYTQKDVNNSRLRDSSENRGSERTTLQRMARPDLALGGEGHAQKILIPYTNDRLVWDRFCGKREVYKQIKFVLNNISAFKTFQFFICLNKNKNYEPYFIWPF